MSTFFMQTDIPGNFYEKTDMMKIGTYVGELLIEIGTTPHNTYIQQLQAIIYTCICITYVYFTAVSRVMLEMKIFIRLKVNVEFTFCFYA